MNAEELEKQGSRRRYSGSSKVFQRLKYIVFRVPRKGTICPPIEILVDLRTPPLGFHRGPTGTMDTPFIRLQIQIVVYVYLSVPI